MAKIRGVSCSHSGVCSLLLRSKSRICARHHHAVGGEDLPPGPGTVSSVSALRADGLPGRPDALPGAGPLPPWPLGGIGGRKPCGRSPPRPLGGQQAQDKQRDWPLRMSRGASLAAKQNGTDYVVFFLGMGLTWMVLGLYVPLPTCPGERGGWQQKPSWPGGGRCPHLGKPLHPVNLEICGAGVGTPVDRYGDIANENQAQTLQKGRLLIFCCGTRRRTLRTSDLGPRIWLTSSAS